MTRSRTPTRADHQRFCVIEGWTQVRTAKGKKGTHHLTYEIVLPDGRILRTRISHPPDRTDYGPALWSHVRHDQLEVNDQEFWACVDEGDLPDRGQRAASTAEPIPAEVAYQLRHKVGLTGSDIAGMGRQQAIDRLHSFWTTGT